VKSEQRNAKRFGLVLH